MIRILKKHTISVRHALEGVLWALKTQPNFRVHLLISTFVFLLGWYLVLSLTEWVVVFLTITIGLVVEMVNTAIEATTDAIDTKIRPDIKIAKDVSAGAMLIYATGAVIIALIMFLPKIMRIFTLQ